jgi:hypothetical protein
MLELQLHFPISLHGVVLMLGTIDNPIQRQIYRKSKPPIPHPQMLPKNSSKITSYLKIIHNISYSVIRHFHEVTEAAESICHDSLLDKHSQKTQVLQQITHLSNAHRMRWKDV